VRPLAAAGLASLALIVAPAAAADGPLVRLNGEPLGRAELEAYLEQRGGAGDGGAVSEPVAVEELINRELLLQAAERRELASQPEVRRALQRARRDILIDALLRRVAADHVSDQRIAAFYQTHFADDERVPQVRVMRRRAATKAEAQSLRQRLTGDDRATAGEWLFANLQPPALAKALTAAKAGAVVGPVASDGGWAVARVTARRQVAAPPLAQVRDAIRARLEYQAIRNYLTRLRDGATIEYVDDPADGD